MTRFARLLKKVVRNEAMREDPEEIYSWRIFALVAASCFGGMLFGWDIGAIGGILAMPETQAKLGYADAKQSTKDNTDENIVATLQGGCFLACIITPYIADRIGRRLSLIITGVLTTIGVLFQTVATAPGSLALLYVGRFISGLGVGAASMLTPLFVAECAPRAIRGGLGSFYQLFIVGGTMMAFWVNFGAQQHLHDATKYALPLALQALPAICLAGFMVLVPESPRWCAKQDDWERCTQILSKLRSLPPTHEYIRAEVADMAESLNAERSAVGSSTTLTLLREMLVIPGNRRRMLISVALMICQQLSGPNAINYYAPQIFKNLGMSGTSTSLFATGIYGVIKVLANASFLIFAADSLGRRRSLLWTSAAQGVAMFIVGIYGRVSPPETGTSIPPFGYVAIACIYLWVVFFQFGWGPCCWILVSEIPSARLRALNVAIAAATQWLFNFVIARTVLTMQRTMGEMGYGMFFMFGSFSFCMGIFVFFFIPETKGLSLEKMDELFGTTEVKDIEETPKEKAGSIRDNDPKKPESINEDGKEKPTVTLHERI
ncbi:hypothetical protein TD95_001289 [Thielaviopsis punctulata]|uniref:Major facilitator superfamily (MFS) profile domain-containing protein n=1 Tax=Thielaviopsis punctulata TaxID=72032 RepID=A0A0F4ZBV2_9PEZI|nr:hypothetical protein TD95_001289 [Thielaviopsis punctulata]